MHVTAGAPVLERRRMDKSERRSQILAHAKDVFARRGYHACTVDDIVGSAGVARGTFYLYFEDKRAVFSELVDRFLTRMNMVMLRIETDNPSRSVTEQTLSNILRLLELFLSDRAMTKLLLTDAVGLDPESTRKLHSVYDEIVNFFESSLREGQQLGIVAEGDPRIMAHLTIGALKELLLQVVVRSSKRVSAQKLANQIFTFLSVGYLRTSAYESLMRKEPAEAPVAVARPPRKKKAAGT